VAASSSPDRAAGRRRSRRRDRDHRGCVLDRDSASGYTAPRRSSGDPRRARRRQGARRTPQGRRNTGRGRARALPAVGVPRRHDAGPRSS
jgi:hypothetical protein